MSGLEEEFNNDSANAQDQYLLFITGGELYAIEALKAQEIVGYDEITKVPMMNSFIKGVTNIRGNITPVVDLKDRFGLGKTTIADKTSIIVVNCKNDDMMMQIGIMIDEVYEVDYITSENLREAPEFGSKVEVRYIQNMGKYCNEYIPILNTDTILNIDELSELFV